VVCHARAKTTLRRFLSYPPPWGDLPAFYIADAWILTRTPTRAPPMYRKRGCNPPRVLMQPPRWSHTYPPVAPLCIYITPVVWGGCGDVVQIMRGTTFAKNPFWGVYTPSGMYVGRKNAQMYPFLPPCVGVTNDNNNVSFSFLGRGYGMGGVRRRRRRRRRSVNCSPPWNPHHIVSIPTQRTHAPHRGVNRKSSR
jgi:hypothetical protein